MRNTWGVMAGLGMAGLLVAAAPAQAQSGTGSSTTSGTDSSSSYGQPGSKSPGTTGDTGTPGSTSSQTPGTMGSDTTGSMASATSQNEVTGKVDKFDKSKNELTLRLKLSDSAQVMKDGKTASLSDIKPGDEVRASFTGTGDTLEVNRIDVLSAGSSGSSGSHKGSSSGSSSGMGSGTGSSSPSDTGSSSGSSSGRGY